MAARRLPQRVRSTEIPIMSRITITAAIPHCTLPSDSLSHPNQRPYTSSMCTQYTNSDVVPSCRTQPQEAHSENAVHKYAKQITSRTTPSLITISPGLSSQNSDLG